MRRAYNVNISERANRSLSKRESQVRMQKALLAIFLFLMVFLGIIFGTGMSVFAESSGAKTVHKYYKSICVEAGDTLWDIAGEYVQGTGISRKAYVDEICQLNGIEADEIHAGAHLVVIYFSTEVK